MSDRVIHICSFSTLDHLKGKRMTDEQYKERILVVLRQTKRFSTFEVYPRLARLLDQLFAEGKLIKNGGEFPWHNVTVQP